MTVAQILKTWHDITMEKILLIIIPLNLICFISFIFIIIAKGDENVLLMLFI